MPFTRINETGGHVAVSGSIPVARAGYDGRHEYLRKKNPD